MGNQVRVSATYVFEANERLTYRLQATWQESTHTRMSYKIRCCVTGSISFTPGQAEQQRTKHAKPHKKHLQVPHAQKHSLHSCSTPKYVSLPKTRPSRTNKFSASVAWHFLSHTVEKSHGAQRLPQRVSFIKFCLASLSTATTAFCSGDRSHRDECSQHCEALKTS